MVMWLKLYIILNLIIDNLGQKDGQKFFPVIFSIFFIIVCLNLIGLIPYSFTLTSHLIVTFALADPNFEILVQALTRDDLTQNFVGLLSIPAGSAPSPFTVFAPINSGFVNLLAELGVNSLNDIDEPTLSAVLSYHVVVGANQLSVNLSGGMEFTTSLDQAIPGGGNLLFNFDDLGGGILTDNNDRTSNIIALDVQADNGIIHAIDTVVLP